MANPWFRMYHEFATDPKIQMLSEVDQRRYLMLLCLRCCNGDVTLHETEVAFQLRVSEQEWSQTRKALRLKGLIDERNKPTAWDKRQYVSDSSVARVQKHREKKKRDCNVTETKCNAIDTDTESNTDKKEPASKKYKFSEGDYGFAEYMHGAILNIAPHAKDPNYKSWANTVRLMREADKIPAEEIKRIFDWANKDGFWSANILSPNKLRDKFTALSAKANQNETNKPRTSNAEHRRNIGNFIEREATKAAIELSQSDISEVQGDIPAEVRPAISK